MLAENQELRKEKVLRGGKAEQIPNATGSSSS